jgi:PAS domain S-box-containing protein
VLYDLPKEAMSNRDPTYQELQDRLAQAEAILTALRSGEVDAVISYSAGLLLCVQEVEAALREGEARYRSLFEHSVDAILLTATDGRILMTNPAACRLFGWTAEELDHLLEETLVNYIDPKTMAGWAAWDRAGQFHGELTYLRRDGSTFIGETCSATFGEQNGEKKTTVIIRDVTKRKRAEAAVLEAQAELARITRALTIGELAVSMSHELNQPLGAIVNNGAACLRLLDEAAEAPAETREALSEIIEDARRASAILARVRKLSNQSSYERTRVRLQDVVDQTLAQAQRDLAERRITLRTELPEDLPSVAGDRIQLQQVLFNLVMNAIDAVDGVEERRRIVKITGRPDELGAEPAVLIAVQDFGCGFKSEDGERLFEPFYTTKTGRMGMGLRISRSIAETHGGRLWAQANADAGATFFLALPAETSAAS